MLKTVSVSSNRKLGGCAVTYRSGDKSVYGTCPKDCPLKPIESIGSTEIDTEYLKAVYDGVVEDGRSWTYTHFLTPDSLSQIPVPAPGKTTINLSTDTINDALTLYSHGYPVVISVPAHVSDKVDVIEYEGTPIRFVRCPAEYKEEVNCKNCGSGSPLCARGDRSYIIKFTAHGSQAKKVGTEESGGCYGTGGPVAIHWKKTMTSEQEVSDSQKLTDWIKTLPKGTLVRHHIVGDLGM
jgi:hypothetical protein